jgi:hypothetical protein
MKERQRGLGISIEIDYAEDLMRRLIAGSYRPTELFWIIRLAPMSIKSEKEVASVPVPATTTETQPTFQIIHNYRQNNNNNAPALNADQNSALESYSENIRNRNLPVPSVHRIRKERRGKKYSTSSQQKREIATRFAGLTGNTGQGDRQQAFLWHYLWRPELEGFQREGELELLAIFGWPPNSQQQQEDLFPQ